MSGELEQLSSAARRAARAQDWNTVRTCARKILKRSRNSAEGHFLTGLADAGSNRSRPAVREFRKALAADKNRYDAAIELMRQLVADGRHAEAFEILDRYEEHLSNSPYYLEIAAATLTRMGLHVRARSLYKRATELQPEIDRFRASLAASSVLTGDVDDAREIYRQLTNKNPQHQQNHYELAKLATARDASHVEEMQAVLKAGKLPAERNIFLYYALGKELEDLERWEESFKYLKLGGDAAKKVSGYDVAEDIELIETVMATCNADWLADDSRFASVDLKNKTPVFIVGLPRTGTTLVERIIASHADVQSIDETHFIELSLKACTGLKSATYMSPAIVKAAADMKGDCVAAQYMDYVTYRLGEQAYFIDKYPENFSYLGLIARAFPRAKIVQVTRHPMDACFAMYKQSYFRYAYTLEDLGNYYVAYRQLRDHWEAILGERLITVSYEALVNDQEAETRTVLDRLGLPFDDNCLRFHENRTPSATASSVQVREKVHNRSVGRWRHFAEQLQPLHDHLQAAGIDIE